MNRCQLLSPQARVEAIWKSYHPRYLRRSHQEDGGGGGGGCIGLGTTGQSVLTNSSWQQGLELCPQLWTIMTISLQSEVHSLVILLRLKLPVGNV